ncbi:hypothetical protein HYH03_002137 [Edaphochlamys debaryana]|uniref:Uncharacterized protein n=1 Tax=Edaphochlamys debaryana TaxID=47281 RepID=A0A835YC20_9CHLO|nr:hypothetical protein HYH03_002137 [Edaphochlamys debaryana]|eukprot:KAG2499846.1 hypothetical protein HYH03_002137 [Edaphochlamys debaryana]
MTPRLGPLACLVALIAIGSCRLALACHELTEGTATESERHLLKEFTQVLKCHGVSGLLVFPYIWKPVSVTVDCGKLQTFKLYVGSSPDELYQRYTHREQAWCSITSLFQPGCQLQLSPFSTNYIGVRKVISTGVPCRFATNHEQDQWMVGACVAGALVFALAGPLSESMALRVTSGGLIFALCSVLVLIWVVGRQMPGRRSLAATAAIMGSSSWALLRWLTGHWLPSAYALLHNRALLAYLGLAGLVGAALTYLYGGTENPKLNTVVRVGLQLLGLVLLYGGTWTQPAVFMALVAAAGVAWLARGAARLIARRGPAAHAHPGAGAGAQAEAWPPATPGSAAGGATPGPFTSGAPTPRLVALQPAYRYGAQPQEPSPYGLGAMTTPYGALGGMGSPLPLTPAQAMYGAGYGAVPPGSGPAPGDMVSPLVRAGMIINPLSGRGIKIGGDLYNRLVEQGYTPDMAAGRLEAPAVPTPASDGAMSSPEVAPGSARRRRNRVV